jgi:hypothetical protein
VDERVQQTPPNSAVATVRRFRAALLINAMVDASRDVLMGLTKTGGARCRTAGLGGFGCVREGRFRTAGSGVV